MAPRNQPLQAALNLRWWWLLLGWLLVFSVIYLSLIPDLVQLKVPQGDKYGHILAYAVLMSWFANLYASAVRRCQFAIGFIALGVGLEFIQQWSGFRSFEIADMAADATGVAAGWWVAPPRLPNYLRCMEKIGTALTR